MEIIVGVPQNCTCTVFCEYPEHFTPALAHIMFIFYTGLY